jgi:hypothetical protein
VFKLDSNSADGLDCLLLSTIILALFNISQSRNE